MTTTSSTLRLGARALVLGAALTVSGPGLAQTCGNGVAEPPEQCDDGNLISGDGCSSTCQLENASARCAGVPTTAGTGLGAVLVASGLSAPVHVAAPPLDPNRLFIVERTGRVRIVKNGTLLAAAFLDLSSRVSAGPEQGLLSIAFHPSFKTNRRFFVNFTDLSGNTVIERYEASTANPDVADVASRRALLTIGQPFANHNGGQLAFGPDNYLYVGMGDGGGSGDPLETGQSNTTALGKMLRLDIDRDTPPFYNVPPSNPNPGGGSVLGLIWAKGLRNPWRFSFDRVAGDLYIGDVGEAEREEINYAPVTSTGGENYGWDVFEGSLCFDPAPLFPTCPAPTGFVFPVHEYSHDDGCAVVGGFVYRGCAMPDLRGTYFFGDHCAAFVHTLRVDAGVATDLTDRTADLTSGGAGSLGAITSFGEDARGELYIVVQSGQVLRIIAVAATPTPTATWTEPPTATATVTATATATPTAVDTATSTALPTATPTATFIEVTPTAIVVPPTATTTPVPPQPTPCVGDVDGDGRVGPNDLVLVARAMLTIPGRPRWNPAADVNRNGIVDPIDLLIVAVSMVDPRCR